MADTGEIWRATERKRIIEMIDLRLMQIAGSWNESPEKQSVKIELNNLKKGITVETRGSK